MNVTLSKSARRALGGLAALRGAFAPADTNSATSSFVDRKRAEAARSRAALRRATLTRWVKRIGQFFMLGPVQSSIATACAIGLALLLGAQPVIDALQKAEIARAEGIAREQGKNQIRAEQDAELIKHHAQGGVKVTVFARNDDPKSLAAARAALVELGAK